MRVCFLLFCLLFSSIDSFGQYSTNDQLTMNGHIVHSSINNHEYQLYVSLPSSYNEKADVVYPVLYVLDAYYSFPMISSMHKLLDFSQEIKDVIIVAIGDKDQSTPAWFKNRMIDYTPSNDLNVDEEVATGLGLEISEVTTGGASKFLQCLRQDIVPYIDNHYKTSKDRGITGHSVGGLFAAYCLLNASDLFNHFGINSASLFWNNNEMISAVKNSLVGRDKRVFLSYGSLEPEVIISCTNLFIDALKQYKIKDSFIIIKVFEEETHTSVIGASMSKTLKILYNK